MASRIKGIPIRALEIGLSIADLESVNIGMLYDMITEKSSDENGYIHCATQKDNVDRK